MYSPKFKLNIIFSLTIILFLKGNNGAENSDTLKLVQMVFRHGDKEADTVYPGGKGKLTDIGKKQLFDLGLLLRERYSNFIQNSYDPTQVKILSTEKDRTIQSAQMLAYGLYKDFNFRASWSQNEPIPFEPIPVRTIPKEIDQMLLPENGCARRTEINERVRRQVGDRFFNDNRDLIDYYVTNEGSDKAKELVNEQRPLLSRVDDLHLLLEQLNYQKFHNETFQPWTQVLYDDQNERFFSLDLLIMRGLASDLVGKQLMGGQFMKELINNIDLKLEQDQVNMRIYSGHDQTLQYLLILLGLDIPTILHAPPFSAAFIIQLHQGPGVNDEPFLKFFYRNETGGQLFEVPILHCYPPCKVKKFKKLMDNLIAKDFDKACEVRESKGKRGRNQNQLKMEASKLAVQNGIKVMDVIGIVLIAGVGLTVALVLGLQWRRRRVNYVTI